MKTRNRTKSKRKTQMNPALPHHLARNRRPNLSLHPTLDFLFGSCDGSLSSCLVTARRPRPAIGYHRTMRVGLKSDRQ